MWMWILFTIIMLFLFIVLWLRRDEHAIIFIGLMMVWMGHFLFPEYYPWFYALGVICLIVYIWGWKRGLYSKKDQA